LTSNYKIQLSLALL